MKLLVLFILFYWISPAFSQINASVNVHIKLPISGKIIGEPHLSVAQHNPKMLLAAAVVIDPKSSDSIYTMILTSNDGGQNWRSTLLTYGTSNDPWTLITKNGVFLVSTLHKDGILIHRSVNQGKSWNQPYLIKGIPGKNNYDHETMIESRGKIYVCAERRKVVNKETFEEILLAESNDGGRKFSRQRVIRTGNLGMNTFTVTALQNGMLLIPFCAFNYENSDTVKKVPKIHYVYSLKNFDDVNIFPRFITDKEGKSFPVMHTVKRGNHERVFYIFTNEDRNQVLFTYSDNAGSYFVNEKSIFTDIDSVNVYFPQLVCDARGNILAAWFNSNKSGNQELQVSVSTDFGNSFSKPQTITDRPFNNQVIGNGWTIKNFALAGGHYFGIVSSGANRFQLLWADSRTGQLELYFSEIEINN